MVLNCGDVSMKQLTLYLRSGCHLCEAMEAELQPFITSCNLDVQRIFIDNNNELEQLYGHRIPVLMYKQQLVCEYFFDPDVLQKVMSRASGK